MDEYNVYTLKALLNNIFTLNKSPRGLNAHLNVRKLPVVQLGVCHQLEKLWGPPRAPMGPCVPFEQL